MTQIIKTSMMIKMVRMTKMFQMIQMTRGKTAFPLTNHSSRLAHATSSGVAMCQKDKKGKQAVAGLCSPLRMLLSRHTYIAKASKRYSQRQPRKTDSILPYELHFQAGTRHVLGRDHSSKGRQRESRKGWKTLTFPDAPSRARAHQESARRRC